MNKQNIIESLATYDDDELVVVAKISDELKPDILKGIEQIIAHYQKLDDSSDER